MLVCAVAALFFMVCALSLGFASFVALGAGASVAVIDTLLSLRITSYVCALLCLLFCALSAAIIL